MEGKRLEGHRILELVGKGGMGRVHRVVHEATGQERALKVLPRATAQDPERIARFHREIRIMGELSHPHLLAIHSSGTWNDQAYLLMEFLRGETLEERFLREGPLPLPLLVEIGRAVSSALAYMHDRGIWHRDVKPGNIFLAEGRGPVLMDFGLAKDERLSAITQDSDEVFGSVTYVPPELLRGEGSCPASDFYQLGLSLLEGAVGHFVFNGRNPGEVMVQVLERRLPPLEELAPELRKTLWPILDRCLAPRPSTRHGDARSLEGDFARIDGTPGPNPDDTMALSRSSREDDTSLLDLTPLSEPDDEPPPPPSMILRLIPGARHVSYPTLVVVLGLGLLLAVALLLRSLASPKLETSPIESQVGPREIRLRWTSSQAVRARFLVRSHRGGELTEYEEAEPTRSHRFELRDLKEDQLYRIEVLMEPYGLRRHLELKTRSIRLLRPPRHRASMTALKLEWQLGSKVATELRIDDDSGKVIRRLDLAPDTKELVLRDLPPMARLEWSLRSGEHLLHRGRLRLGPRLLTQTPEGRNLASNLAGNLAVRQGPLRWKDLCLFADTNGNLYAVTLSEKDGTGHALFTWRVPSEWSKGAAAQIHGLALGSEGKLYGLVAGRSSQAFCLDLPWRRTLASREGGDPTRDPEWTGLSHSHGEWRLDLGRGGRYRGLLSTLHDGKLFVTVKGLGQITLICVDLHGPAVRWALPIDAIRYRGLTIHEGVGYLSLTELPNPTRAELEADPFEQPPGKSESGWTFPPSPYTFPPKSRGHVLAVALDRGKPLWRFDLDGPAYAQPVIDPKTGLLLVASMNGLHALSAKERERLGANGPADLRADWGEWRLGKRGIISSPLRLGDRLWLPWRTADHTLLFEMARPTLLELVDARPLPELRCHLLPGSIRLPMYQTFISDPLLHGERIYLSCLGHLYCWDPKKKRLDWQYDSGHIIGSELCICNDTLFFGTENGRLLALDLIEDPSLGP